MARKMNNDYDSVRLGIFGFTWQEKVAADMVGRLDGDDKKQISSLKYFWQPSGLNINLINSMYDFYLISGGKDMTAETLSELASVSENVARAFLASLAYCAESGLIEYKIYDISVSQDASAAKSEIFSDSITSVVSTVNKSLNTILAISCVVAIIWFIPKPKG